MNIAFLVGALLPTLLLSRLFFLILKKWDGRIKKIFLVHAVSWFIAGLIGGMGMAEDGGEYVTATALALYVIPQSVWLAYDLFMLKRKERKSSQITT